MKYNLDKEILIDIYQDAFIAFYENCVKGKLNRLNSSVKTYLFAIGKNMIYNTLKKNKIISDTALDSNLKDQGISTLDELILSEKQSQIYNAIKALGESCQKVLTYFYYDRHSIKEIMTLMNYNSENVTKSKKSQCMKKLKSLIQSYDI